VEAYITFAAPIEPRMAPIELREIDIATIGFGEVGCAVDRLQFKQLNDEIFPVVYNSDFYDIIYTRGNHHAFILMHLSSPVGTLSFKVEAHVAYVFTFGIVKQIRNRGVGGEAWQRVESEFRTRYQCRTIILHTQVSSAVAVSFYKGHGFEISEAIEDYYVG